MMLGKKIPDAFRCVLCDGASVAAIGVPWDAQAQEAVGEHGIRETIVVTGERDRRTVSGTKSQAPLIETPQSITIIDSEELTIEEKILTLEQRKAALADTLWSEDAAAPAHLTEDDITFLLGWPRHR